MFSNIKKTNYLDIPGDNGARFRDGIKIVIFGSNSCYVGFRDLFEAYVFIEMNKIDGLVIDPNDQS